MVYSKRLQRIVDKAQRFYQRNGDTNLKLFRRAKEVLDLGLRTNLITAHRLEKELNPFRRFWRYTFGKRAGMENIIATYLTLYAFVSDAAYLPRSVRGTVGPGFQNMLDLKQAEIADEFDREKFAAALKRTEVIPPKKFLESLKRRGVHLPSIAPLIRGLYISTYCEYPALDLSDVNGIFRRFPTYGLEEWQAGMDRTAANAAPLYWSIMENAGAHELVNRIKTWYVQRLFPDFAAEFSSFKTTMAKAIESSTGLILEIQRSLRESDLGQIITETPVRQYKSLGSAVLSDIARAREEGHESYASYPRKFSNLRDLAAGRVIFDLPNPAVLIPATAALIKDRVITKLTELLVSRGVDDSMIEIVERKKTSKEDGEVEKDYIYIKQCDDITPDVRITITDYYKNPKPNGYKSLHVVVQPLRSSKLTIPLSAFELVIRDRETHEQIENSEAAHFVYKLSRSKDGLAHEDEILKYVSTYWAVLRLSGSNGNGHVDPAGQSYGLVAVLRRLTPDSWWSSETKDQPRTGTGP